MTAEVLPVEVWGMALPLSGCSGLGLSLEVEHQRFELLLDLALAYQD